MYKKHTSISTLIIINSELTNVRTTGVPNGIKPERKEIFFLVKVSEHLINNYKLGEKKNRLEKQKTNKKHVPVHTINHQHSSKWTKARMNEPIHTIIYPHIPECTCIPHNTPTYPIMHHYTRVYHYGPPLRRTHSGL